MPPHLLSNTYVLHESLGEGGMGIVYRATNRLTRQIVALKQLRARRRNPTIPGPEQTQTSDTSAKGSSRRLDARVALVREFQTLSSLHHPNVIRVFDYGFDEACGPYFTMEMLSSPRNIRAACADASVEEKLDPLVQLLRGLVYVHRRNIIHCDLKPSNVLLVDGQVKLLDFGIAFTNSIEPLAAGTIGYVAPEVLLGGAPTVASDLFSFGVLAYQLFAGRFPYDMSSASSFLRGLLNRTVSHLDLDVTMVAMAYLTLGDGKASDGPRGPLPLEGLGRLTEPLNRVVMRLLAPTADQRYPSAEAVIDDLGRALGVRVFVDTADTRESFLKSAEFVGRDEELAVLLGALESAALGRGSGWLVGGESGVGKSRLIEELRTLALVQSAQVVRTRATLEHARPYQLWAPLVRALAVYVGVDDDEASVLKDIVPDIGSLLERPVRDASRVAPALARERLFGVVLGVLRRHQRPLVVVLEDLQWADGDSLTLLDFLSPTFTELPLLVVANYRDDERPELPSLIPALKTISLKRLPAEVIGRLVASMLGASGASADLTEFLQKETEGNALFLVEALRALAEETTRLSDVTKIDLPEHIVTGGMARVIQRRLDRLPKDLLPLLRLAAVAGRRIDREVLEMAAPEHDVGAWLMISANAAILETQDGLWQFTHDKLRERILSELAPDETRQLHRRVAEALKAVHGDSSEKQPILAYHYKHADMPDEAARFFESSANESARLGAVVDARQYYAAALAELARVLPETEDLRRRSVDVAVQLATISWYSVPPRDTLLLMAEAEKRLESIERPRWSPLDHGRAASVCLFRGRGIYALSRTAEALTSYRTGLEHVAKSGDVPAEILLKVSVGQSLMILGHFKESLPYLEEAVGVLASAGNWLEWSRVAGFLGMTLAGMGDLDRSLDVLESSAKRTRELKSSTYLALLHIYPTVVNLWIENWPDMLHEGRECARIAVEGKDLGVACLGLSMWEWAAIRMGDRAAADSAREQFSVIHDRLGGSTLDDWYAVAQIDRALAFGSPEEAASIAEQTVARSKERGSIIGEALANRSWARALGRMDRYQEAETCLATSLRVSDEAGASMLSARTYLAWADLCRAKGDARQADRYTDFALHAAESPVRTVSWRLVVP